MNFYLSLQKRKNQASALVSTIATATLLFGCAPRQELLSCPLPEAIANLQQTQTIQLSIALDGTLSMQGYVNGQSNSRYQQTLRLIDSASSTGWSNAAASAKYYRFGLKQQSISRDVFLQAQLPAFYQSGSDYRSSKIDAALSEPGDTKLSIIVTDLYQDSADVLLIQKLLAQGYLEKGYAIGVLGIKSEFQGTVYDVGITNQNFTYSTVGQNSRTLHPFYVLLLGTYGNISHFYSQLQRNGLTAVEHEFNIFFPQPIAQAATLNADVKMPPRRDILQPKALNDGRVMVRKKKADEPIQFLSITNKTSPEPIPVELSYQALKGVLPIDPKTIAFTVEKSQFKTKGFESVVPQGLQMTDWNLNGQTLRFNARFNPEPLQTGIYRFNIHAFPTELVQPAWWEAWNAPEGSLDGSKTNNLLPFLRGLKLRTAELMKQQKPSLARLCYVVQKK